MPRILVINPNRTQACTDGIAAAVAPFRLSGAPAIDVIGLPDGPPAIYDWQDWHAAAGPLCRCIETQRADAYVIACGSDPGIDAARAVTTRPVFGIFRCAVAAAMARTERFGVVALVDASIPRHGLALRAMGVEARLAAEVAMNVSMEALLDPAQARAGLIAAGRKCAEHGAGAVILGCTGMSHHRSAIEHAIGVPVIDPCQASVALAMQAVLDT